MTQTLMTPSTRYAIAARVAAAQGRTLAAPFPSDAYLSAGFDAAVAAHPVAALIDPADRAALSALIEAVS